MSCSPFDLRDYFLQELPEQDRRQVESHIKGCQSCGEELERLQLTESALFSLRDEEIPQRIGFVSDKVFEPSPWRRAWGALWNSSGRLAFFGAAMLSAAILVSALTRPAPAPVVVRAPAVVASASISDAEIDRRVESAVARAVAQTQAGQIQQIKMLNAELESARQRLILASDEFSMEQKRANTRYLMASNYGPPSGEGTEAK